MLCETRKQILPHPHSAQYGRAREKQIPISLYAEHFGNYQEACERGLRAREACPRDADLAKSLGIAFYHRGDYARAVQLLKESLRQRTDDAELYYYLGMAHNRLKEVKAARAALSEALALAPDSKLAPETKRILAELK